MALIDSLIKEGWLKTPAIIDAFRKVKREDFINWKGRDSKRLAEINEALPIGYSQTISQPLTVAFMLEKLEPKPGDKVLDIGSGSGWTTALLACIVGKTGKVIAIEIVPELKEFGESNARHYEGNMKFILGDGSEGFEKEAPFDRILASASALKIPEKWKKQLKTGGKIVAPVKNSIVVLEKEGDNKFRETGYPGFSFVPLV